MGVNMQNPGFKNPFRPGAGHEPPYLAGRENETREFRRLLGQDTILENMVLTGLRGVGKTVLLDTFKPLAIGDGWLWVGADLSESASVNEQNMATRLLTDLSVVTSGFVIERQELSRVGFGADKTEVERRLNFDTLRAIYEAIPGLTTDKVRGILEIVWNCVQADKRRGIVFAYDEAQNLSDHAAKEQYPLSLLLDVFQSIQRKGIPFMLVLTGLPTLFPKLVETRTFAERMFRVVFLDRLSDSDSRDAILKPVEMAECPVRFTERSVQGICEVSGGYPYFLQFICREVYDVFVQKLAIGEELLVPPNEILRKLDTDFFAGRWSRATDRQRELLGVIAKLPTAGSEFTVQEIVELSQKELAKPFSSSHVNQMLSSLSDAGLIYKNRHGKYSFAVPLLDQFILRQMKQSVQLRLK